MESSNKQDGFECVDVNTERDKKFETEESSIQVDQEPTTSSNRKRKRENELDAQANAQHDQHVLSEEELTLGKLYLTMLDESHTVNLSYVRKLIHLLNSEESGKRRNLKRPFRLLIYEHNLIEKQLLKAYKTHNDHLLQLRNLHETNFADQIQSALNLLEMHTELSKLLFDLTSPVELFTINRHLILAVVNRSLPPLNLPSCNTNPSHLSGTTTTNAPSTSHSTAKNEEAESKSNSANSSFQEETHEDLTDQESDTIKYQSSYYFHQQQQQKLNSTLNHKIVHSIQMNIEKFKDLLIRNPHFFEDVCRCIRKLIELYVYLNEHSLTVLTSQQQQVHLDSAIIRGIRLRLFNAIILNLCLVRNLSFEKNDTRLTLILKHLFHFKLDHVLLNCIHLINKPSSAVSSTSSSSSAGQLSKYEQHSFVMGALLCQIVSLMFSKLNSTLNNVSSTSTTGNARVHRSHHHYQQQQQQIEAECKSRLSAFAIDLCKTGMFVHLCDNMLKFLHKPTYLHYYFDISYFLWLIKFILGNFMLNIKVKQGDCVEVTDLIGEPSSSKSQQSQNQSQAQSQQQQQQHTLKKSECLFISDYKNRVPMQTRKFLFSYELFAFVCMKMFENFEQLIFDSNKKNMLLIDYYRQKEHLGRDYEQEKMMNKKFKCESGQPKRVANTNALRLFYLSLNCMNELINCLKVHLAYLTTFNQFSHSQQSIKSSSTTTATITSLDTQLTHSSMVASSDAEFVNFLNEYLNFDDLKQSFPFFMRFYCYNQHLYPDSLIKLILFTNQSYLNTYEMVYDYLKQAKVKTSKHKPNIEKRQEQQEQQQVQNPRGSSVSPNKSAARSTSKSPKKSNRSSSTSSATTSSSASDLSMKTTRMNSVYNLYANSDTSYILRYILSRFVSNDPLLNRCVIDFLDKLMSKSERRERLFHMNMALSLANIAMLDNFNEFDQRTKDLVMNMLREIRRLCKHRPTLANKLLFDVHNRNRYQTPTKNVDNESTEAETRHKRHQQNKSPSLSIKSNSEDNSLINPSPTSSTSSSWSSLRSTTSVSQTESSELKESPRKRSPTKSLQQKTTSKEDSKSERPSICNVYLHAHKHVNDEIRILIENEFLYSMHSLDGFNLKSSPSSSGLNAADIQTGRKQADSQHEEATTIMKNDNLYRIFNHLLQSFDLLNSSESVKKESLHKRLHEAAEASTSKAADEANQWVTLNSSSSSEEMETSLESLDESTADKTNQANANRKKTSNRRNRLSSWQIYNCLVNMRFNINDRENYLSELEKSKSSGKFALGFNLGFGQFKDDFYKSNECINLRMLCSTNAFRRELREAYIKYLIEKLCIKSKRTRNAIFWLFNKLRRIRYYLKYLESSNMDHLSLSNNMSLMNVSTFELKLICCYHLSKLGIPLIPLTYELQQVFHSEDFSHLLDIFGIVRPYSKFPYVAPDWLDDKRQSLYDCLSIMEKCLCI